MTRKTRGRKKKRRATAGSFRPGPDPRRHRFTVSDCRVGWLVANCKHPELREWLKMRLFVYYSAKHKEEINGEEGKGGRSGTRSTAAEWSGRNDNNGAGGSDADIPW